MIGIAAVDFAPTAGGRRGDIAFGTVPLIKLPFVSLDTGGPSLEIGPGEGRGAGCNCCIRLVTWESPRLNGSGTPLSFGVPGTFSGLLGGVLNGDILSSIDVR